MCAWKIHDIRLHSKIYLFSLALILTANAAVGGEYWPTDDQGLYVYEDGAQGTKRCEILGTPDSFSYTFQHHPFSILTHKANFGFDRSGNLMLTRFMDSVGGQDATSYGYDRPVQFLKANMRVGDSWQHTGVCTITDAGPIAFTAEMTVLAQETVTVPAGTFETLRVAITGLIPYYLCGTYNLHNQLGPVKINDWNLVHWKGTVPAAKTSWGGVKGLFR